jgi:plastocyanin domain-containing protein
MNARNWWVILAGAVALGAPVGALAASQARTVELAVTTKGFEPARVKVARGEPLKLVVTRKTDDTCAKEIVIADENIKADLPLNKPVALSFTPKRAGEIKYACGMNMVTGVLDVQ